MKDRFLRALYYRYKTYFYGFLQEEFLYDIPKDVREPAMTFLSQGRDRLEKWALFQAHILQTKLTRDPDKIREYQGMMLMLKLLLVHTVPPSKRPELPVEERGEVRDDIKEATEAVAELKKLYTPQSVDEKK